jgi:hypothetical protein
LARAVGSTRKALLAAKFIEGFLSRLASARQAVCESFANPFHRIRIFLLFPIEVSSDGLLDGRCEVLPVPLRLIVPPGPAFGGRGITSITASLPLA